MIPPLNTFLLVLAAIFPVVNPPGIRSRLFGIDPRRGAGNPPHPRLACGEKLVLRSNLLALAGRADPRVLRHIDPGAAGRRRFRGCRRRVEALQRGQPKGTRGLGRWRFANRSARSGVLSADAAPHHGAGTIAVVISLGLSKASSVNSTEEILFVLATLSAVVVIAATIFLCFAYADRIQQCSAPAAPTSPCGCRRSSCFALAFRFYGQAEASF